MSKYWPGMDCRCCASNEGECACSVDWTDPKIYKLKRKVKKLKAKLELKDKEIAELKERLSMPF